MTKFVNHHHFAHKSRNLEEENRLLMDQDDVKHLRNLLGGSSPEKPSMNADDDGEENPLKKILEMAGTDMPNGKKGKPLSPIGQIIGDNRKHILNESGFLRLLNDAQQGDTDGLRSFLASPERRKQVLYTLAEEKNRIKSAMSIKTMMDKFVKGEDSDINHLRQELQRIFTEEQIKTMEKAKEKEGAENKNEEKEQPKKPSARSVLKKYQEVLPLFTPLDTAERCLPGMPEFGESVDKLCDPLQRDGLLAELTSPSIRTELLTDLTPRNAGKRLEGMRALCTFLSQAQYLVTPANKARFLDGYSRTRMRLTFLEDYIRSQEPQVEDTHEMKNELAEQYQKKFSSTSSFLRGERNMKQSKGDLAKRLSNHGDQNSSILGEQNVFRELSKGLSGGWIDQLPISDAEKYTCSLIALEEIGALFLSMAQGFVRAESVGSIMSQLQNRFLGAVRKRIRSKDEDQEHKTTSISVELTNPKDLLREAQELEVHIQEQVNDPHAKPNMAEVDEFLLLVAWVEGLGLTYSPSPSCSSSQSERLGYRRQAKKSPKVIEAQAQQDLSRVAESTLVQDALLTEDPESLTDSERKSQTLEKLNSRNPRILYDALVALREERSLHQLFHIEGVDAKFLQSCTYTQLAKIAKEELNSDHATVGQLLRKCREEASSDEEYLEDLHRLVEKNYDHDDIRPSEEEAEAQRAYVDREQKKKHQLRNWAARTFFGRADEEYLEDRNDEEFDSENLVRQNMDVVTVEEDEELVARTLEAQIQSLAVDYQSQHEETFDNLTEEQMTEALGAVEDSTIGTQETVADTYRRTQEAFEELQSISIAEEPDRASAAKHAIDQLDALADDAQDPLKDASEIIQETKKGRKSAQLILAAVGSLMQPKTREKLQEYTEHGSNPGPGISKLLHLFQGNPRAFLTAEREAVEVEAEREAISTRSRESTNGFADICSEIEKRANGLIDNLELTLRDYETPESYKLQESLIGDAHRSLELVERARRYDGMKHDYAEAQLASAMRGVKRIQQFLNRLEQYGGEPREVEVGEFMELTKTDANPDGLSGNAWGSFDPKNGILLNQTNLGNRSGIAREKTLREERMHALHFAMQEYGYPINFQNAFTNLLNDPRIPQALLSTCTEKWVPRGELSEWEWQDAVGDELLAKWEIFQSVDKDLLNDETERRKNIPLSKNDVLLFRKLKELGISPVPSLDLDNTSEQPNVSLRSSRERAARAAQGDEDAAITATMPETPSGEGEEGEGEGSYLQLSEYLRDAKKHLYNVHTFLQTHPDQNDPENAADFAWAEGEYKNLMERFHVSSEPERDKDLVSCITDFKDVTGEMSDSVLNFEARERDLRGEKMSTGFTRSFLDQIKFMNVFDYIEMFKEIGEDLKRQFDRRKQTRVAAVGHGLTSWIPKNVLYFGKLQDEFLRRVKQSEQDEVEQWKKSLDEMDSYELQEHLRRPANADHAKAILFLLAERGRIDWNDINLWDALSNLSHFSMPIDKCVRNENLREEWLRKLVTDIWDDKELYRKWKQDNDSNIESGKKKFLGESDRLSNIKNGLNNELEKQLRIFVECKKTGKDLPDSVHPHLYEECLDFAIRNGKMSMEDKFFYFIQGIAHGLISADRLRSMAGEEGGVLNIFPFIDYFYGRNNTMPEIIALAERLRETSDWTKDAFYKPGVKTTLWLELEVAREESVRQRLRKGANKKAGEMDHDDMHYFIPRLDTKSVDAMATPQGGGRQQMSTDGWRNAYTGFNSFFKALGILTQLEEDGDYAKFTNEDTRQVVRAISSYIRMDGILTKRSAFGDNKGRRPAISFEEMKHSYAVVSDTGKTVYEEREILDDFMKEVLHEYTSQNQELTDKFVDDLLFDTRERAPTDEEEKAATNTSERLEGALQKAIDRQGVAPLKKVLAKYSKKFVSHQNDLSVENAKKVWHGRKAQELDVRSKWRAPK